MGLPLLPPPHEILDVRANAGVQIECPKFERDFAKVYRYVMNLERTWCPGVF